MSSLGLLSHSIGLISFLILSILMLINWRGQLIGSVLLLTCVVSAGWFASLIYAETHVTDDVLQSHFLEIVRSASWIVFLFVLLKQRLFTGSRIDTRFMLLAFFAVITIILLFIIHYQPSLISWLLPDDYDVEKLYYVGFLVLPVLGLLLIEKFYRSSSISDRWAIKYLCLGVGGLFAYDFFLYSDTLLLNRISADLFDARGIINALCVPLIAVSVARNPEWKLQVFISRHVIYGSTTIMAAGLYLLFMSVAGYYIKNVGGTWGHSLQIVFFFGAVVVLLVLIFSSDLRTKTKIFLAKHFYRNKYDYREEWLEFTQTLSENKSDDEFYETIIKAISRIIKSQGGALWLLQDNGQYRLETLLNFSDYAVSEFSHDDQPVKSILDKHWVIDLEQYRKHPSSYDSIDIPEWIASNHNLRLIVPLFNGSSLIAFIIFLNPSINIKYNWEDFDLLKTVGKQSASYIALYKTTEALSQARQFEAFNRLSAFIVHDLKNLIAQLSLVSSNSYKFRDNKEFLDDAFETIENAVSKMKRLLNNLRKGERPGDITPHPVRINDLINEVVRLRQVAMPIPQFYPSDNDIFISLDKDRFITVLEHLIQNAQEATPDTGSVEIKLVRHADTIEIQIVDTGCGMDETFIRMRLFKPFDTTKGNAGMGIGAYESREAIYEMGGRLVVNSNVGKGTTLSVFLPCNIILKHRAVTAGTQ